MKGSVGEKEAVMCPPHPSPIIDPHEVAITVHL